ncbi:FAD-binding domain-containing protein [Xylariaceae sp. AK1471]|nr:FAD-binding domain-containing protein [Xylariaceae sp. AK1471]
MLFPSSLSHFLLIPFLVSPPVAYAAPRADQGAYDPAIIKANNGAISAPPKNNTAFTCKALRIAMGGGDSLLTSDMGEAYEDLIEDNYSSTCWLAAACVVSPANTTQVARVISILDALDTKFSIRSGGHKQNPGYGSIGESGVLVSLANVNTLSLSKDKTTIKVGSGNRWQSVYDYLVPQGLVVIGGRVGIVGVGGFMLGGGLSYLSNQYGLAMDNVKSYEVVLASGRIVNASSSQNSDLYRALRGGAANFGIVTTFELQVYPQGPMSFEARAYGLNQTAEVLTALAEFNNVGMKDPLSSFGLQIQETGPIVLLQYSAAVHQPDCFKPFYDITSFKQYFPPTNGSLLDALALSGGGFAPVGVRTYGETFTHTVDAAFMIEAYQIFAAEITKLPEGASGTWIPNPISVNIAKRGLRNGGNVIGLAQVPQQWHEWFIQWSDPKLDDQIYSISNVITTKLVKAAKKRGTFLPYVFMNTAGTHQEVLKSFGDANVRTIKQAASKYDPGRTFQRLQNDGQLIRNL